MVKIKWIKSLWLRSLTLFVRESPKSLMESVIVMGGSVSFVTKSVFDAKRESRQGSGGEGGPKFR